MFSPRNLSIMMYARPFETKAQCSFGKGINVFSAICCIDAASVRSTYGPVLTILLGEMRQQMPSARYRRADARKASLVKKRRKVVSLTEAEAGALVSVMLALLRQGDAELQKIGAVGYYGCCGQPLTFLGGATPSEPRAPSSTFLSIHLSGNLYGNYHLELQVGFSFSREDISKKDEAKSRRTFGALDPSRHRSPEAPRAGFDGMLWTWVSRMTTSC